jgi:tripartite-type tricarboxylate transporter receptor subunit TctC
MVNSAQVRKTLGAAISVVAFLMGGFAWAQSYPARPIVFLDNIPGGPQEALKRAILAKIKDNTGAILVYEARGGGGGAPALQVLKNAAPDGYTFGLTYQSALTLNTLMFGDLGIDPLKDFVAVSKLWFAGNVWSARADHPAKDLRDLVAMAKARPESVKVGVFGAGNRFFVAQLEEKTGAKFLQVPYKALSDGTIALLSGQIDAAFDGISSVQGQKGKLKILTYGSDPRLPQFPDVPTARELYGIDTGSWVGLIAPARVGQEQINWVAREIGRAMKDPNIAQIMNNQTYTVIANTPAEFTSQLRAEVDENRTLIQKYPDIR